MEPSGFCSRETNLSGFILWTYLTLLTVDRVGACLCSSVSHESKSPGHLLKFHFSLFYGKKKIMALKPYLKSNFFIEDI